MEEKHNILIVDDEVKTIKSLIRALGHEQYSFSYTTNPQEALGMIERGTYDIIISDQKMPNVTGIELLKYSKKIAKNTVRILITGYSEVDILISAINEGNIFRYIAKPWNNDKLVETIQDAVIHKRKQEKAEQEINQLLKNNEIYQQVVFELKENLNKKNQHITNALLKITKARDLELFNHSQNVYYYSLYIAELLNLSKKKINVLKYASLFHDIGKVVIRDNILFKPGALTINEFMNIKYHTVIGSEIIKELGFPPEVSKVISQHHERLDGKGYPFGIKGEDILLESRIIAVADSYEALISDRVYRKKMTREEAIAILKNDSGKYYDETIVSKFIGGVLKCPVQY